MALSPVVGLFDVDLRSAAMIDWLADATLVAKGRQTGSIARTTIGSSKDSSGHIYKAVANQPRWDENSGILGLLVEPARTNVVLQSENFGTTWTTVGTTSRSAAALSSTGVVLDLLGDASGGNRGVFTQAVTFTGDGVKAFSLFVCQGSSSSTLVRIYNTTTTATVLSATITWTGAVPTISASVGSALSTQALVDGVYRLFFQTDPATAANTHAVEISPAASSAGDIAPTGTIYTGGVQAENGPMPTSYMKTTSSTSSRTAETCSFSIDFAPQVLTVFGEIAWKGNIVAICAPEANGSTHGVFSLGDTYVGTGQEALTLDFMTSGSVLNARLTHQINSVGVTLIVPIGNLSPPVQYAANLTEDGNIGLTLVGGNGAIATGSSL